MSLPERHDALAAVLDYPGEGREARLDRAVDLLEGEAREAVLRHRESCRGLDLGALQEDYTRTFDLDPACSLEVGWHLFGENYARGEFLVEMRRALRGFGLAETGELPDHLVHVLPIAGRLDAEKASGFAKASLLPALDKMLAAFEGKDGRWKDLLVAARACAAALVVPAPKEVVRG